MSHDLIRMIEISEDIKKISLGALRIERLAINATLLAKRVGSKAAGFSVITDELRSFSLQLAECMKELRNIVYQRIMRFSESLLLQTRLQLLKSAGAKHAYQHLLQSSGTSQTDLINLGKSMSERVEHAADLFRFADVICRGAKIESAYGGMWQEQLADIADQFAELIDSTSPVLDHLTRHI